MNKIIKINLNTIERVKNFIKTVEHDPCDCYIHKYPYTVDGKSIMGIFSLDLSTPLKLELVSDKEEDIQMLIEKIDYFTMKDEIEEIIER